MAEDLTREAQKIWNALRVMVDAEIDKRTASCVRSRKMTVMSAPNGSTIGVAEPFGQTVNIPYSSALSNVKVGDTVWVDWKFGNASTMVAMATGEGQIVPDYFDVNNGNRNLLEARKFIQTNLSDQGDLDDATADTVPMDYTGVGASNYYIHVSPSTKYRLTLYDTRIETDTVSCKIAEYNTNGTFVRLAASAINWRQPEGLTFVTSVNTAFLRLSLVGFPKYRWKLEVGENSTEWQPSPEDVSPYTFDTVPTNNSKNPVTSDGVYDALETKLSLTGGTMTGKVYSRLQSVEIGGTSDITEDTYQITDKNNVRYGLIRTQENANGSTELSFIHVPKIGTTNVWHSVTLGVNSDKTKYVTVSDQDAWCTGIGAVNKAGDTMTGTLNSTQVRVYDASYPMLAFISAASDTSALGAIFENISQRRMVVRQRSTAGYTENYQFPSNVATSADAWYDILTSKGGVSNGDITAPNYVVKGSADGVNPSVMGRNQNGQSLGTIDFLVDGRVRIRSYNVGVASENYYLPPPTATGLAEYNILTSKRIRAGTTVMTDLQGSSARSLISTSTLNSLFGVADSSVGNTVVWASNGDHDAYNGAITVAFKPSINQWVAQFTPAATGAARINWVAYYFG